MRFIWKVVEKGIHVGVSFHVGYVPQLKSEYPIHYALYVIVCERKSVLIGIEKRGFDVLGQKYGVVLSR